MATLGEQLTDEFYRWEAIGRGEKLWSDFVDPEPPFVPFFWHGAFLERPTPVDDGAKPGFFAKAKSLLGAGEFEPPESASYAHLLESLEVDDPPQHILDHRETLQSSEFRILIPEDLRIDQKRFEQFLHTLGTFSFPISFEIVALNQCIYLQIATHEADAELFCEMFSGYFPEIPLGISTAGTLWDLISLFASSSVVSRELALKKEFFNPVKSLRECEVDPYQALFSSLGNLQDDTMILYQVTFAPTQNSWAKSVRELTTDHTGKPFFDSRPEDARNAESKNRKPYFGVRVRLSAFASTENRCREVLRPIAGSFSLLEGENSFVLADQDSENDPVHLMNNIGLRLSKRSGMLLNSDELLSLVHLPGPDVHAPKLVRPPSDIRELPETLQKDDGLLLGNTGEETPVHLSTPERLRHMHVLGASGTGKSTFIANSIIQDIEAGRGVALLDPHGDLVAQVLEQIPENRVKDVIYFDPADSEYPIGFNLLSARTEAQKNLLASDFVAVIQRLSSSWGDNMTAVLGNAVMAFLESPRGGTLLDLRRFLNEEAFRNEILETVEEPEVKYFWTHEFPLVRGSSQASLVTRLGSFIRQKLLRNMVAQSGEQLDFGDIMDSGKIFLAPLAQGLIGEECSYLLGSSLVSKFYQTALSRQDRPESERSPFFLYLDEAHNFVTPSISSILSGTRKYGLGLILAHQGLDQFRERSSSTLSSVITNAHSRIYFKLGDQDARKLEEGFEHFDGADLRRLGRGEAVCRVGGAQNDFLLRTYPPKPTPPSANSVQESVLEFSRKEYGTPLSEVTKQLEDYYKAAPPRKRASKKAAKAAEAKTASKPAEPTKKEKPPATDTQDQEIQQPDAQESDKEALTTEESVPNNPQVESIPASQEVKPKQEEKSDKAEKKRIPDLSPESMQETRPYESIRRGKTEGRGGPVHKGIQASIKQHAMGMGLTAQIEAKLPGGNDAVDVLIQSKTKQIAVEVAFKSPLDQEIKNIRKCLGRGFDEILIASNSPEHLQKIKDAAGEASLGKELQDVKFLSLSQLTDFLSEFGTSLDPTETENLGYIVKTNFVPKSSREVEERKARINRAIAETRRKLKEGEDPKTE